MLGINAPKILVKGEFARSVREKAIRSMKAAAEEIGRASCRERV